MVVTIKKRFCYYKKFEIDIWGIVKTTLDINRSLYTDRGIFFKKRKKNRFKRYAPLTHKSLFSRSKRFKTPWVSRKISKICGLFWYWRDKRRQKAEAQFGRYVYRLDVLPPIWQPRRLPKSVITKNVVHLFYIIYTSRQFKRLSKTAARQHGSYRQNYTCLLEGRLCSVVYRAGFFNTLFDSLKFVKQGHVWVDGTYRSFVYFSILPMQMLGFNPVFKGTILWSLLRRLNRRLILANRPKYMYISYTFLFFFWKRVPNLGELVNPIGVDMFRACYYNT